MRKLATLLVYRKMRQQNKKKLKSTTKEQDFGKHTRMLIRSCSEYNATLLTDGIISSFWVVSISRATTVKKHHQDLSTHTHTQSYP